MTTEETYDDTNLLRMPNHFQVLKSHRGSNSQNHNSYNITSVLDGERQQGSEARQTVYDEDDSDTEEYTEECPELKSLLDMTLNHLRTHMLLRGFEFREAFFQACFCQIQVLFKAFPLDHQC